LQVKEITDAAKVRKGRGEAIALAKSASKIVVARGKKVVGIDMDRNVPDDDTLAGLLLGPSGNLRAPTIRDGATLFVGFSEEAYRRLVQRQS
jgi:hypothetical protein